jgi:hypothetical protein
MPESLRAEVERRYQLLGGSPIPELAVLTRGSHWRLKRLVERSLVEGDGSYAEFYKRGSLATIPDSGRPRLMDYTLVREKSSESQPFDPMKEVDLLSDFERFGLQLQGRGLWAGWLYDDEIVKEAVRLHERYGSLKQRRSIPGYSAEIDDDPFPNLARFGYECLSFATALEVHNAIQKPDHTTRKIALKSLLEYRLEQRPSPLGEMLTYFNTGDLLDDKQFKLNTGPWLAATISAALREFAPVPRLNFASLGRSDFKRGISIPNLGAALWSRLEALVLDRATTQKCAYVNCPYDFISRRKNQSYCHPEREGRNCKRNHDRWLDRQRE